jgi:nucleoside-diphosphate-sugar epimerase
LRNASTADSLAGRFAVVTGAARGIGDAVAERLLADGAHVFSLEKLMHSEPDESLSVRLRSGEIFRL